MTKQFNPTKPVVDFKGEPFVVDIKNPEYRRKNKIFYLFEEKKGQIIFANEELAINQKVIRSLFIEELPKQLVAGLRESAILTMNIILFIILSLLGGFGLGWIVSGLV